MRAETLEIFVCRGNHRPRDFDFKEIAERGMFNGATHADVERIVRRVLKDMVIKGGELRLNVEHLETARRRENAGSRKRRNLEPCTNRSATPRMGSGKIGTLD